MVKRGKELYNVKGNNAHVISFEPSYPDEVSQVKTCIDCCPLPDTA